MPELTNTRIINLPMNTTSKAQPMDQGVIQNFKTFYQRSLFQRCLHFIEGENNFELNHLNALFKVQKAWD